MLNSRVGREVFRQVAPVAPILELIQDAIQDLSLCPNGRSRLPLLGQEWCDDLPLRVA